MTKVFQNESEDEVSDIVKITVYLTAYKSYYKMKLISSTMNKDMTKEEVESLFRKLKHEIGFYISMDDLTSGDNTLADNALKEYDQFKTIKDIICGSIPDGSIDAFCEYVYNAKEYVGITPENVVYYPIYLTSFVRYLAKMISKEELEVSFLRREANGEIKIPSFGVVRRDIVRCIEVMNEIEQKVRNSAVQV